MKEAWTVQGPEELKKEDVDAATHPSGAHAVQHSASVR
jgi:hypothetical protein